MRPVFVAFLCAGAGLTIAPAAALAAAPAYCALYAREYGNAKIQAPSTTADVAALERLQNQAYFRCLNADSEPAFPETSAYFGASMGEIAGDTSGGIGEGDVSGNDVPVLDNVTASWSQKKIDWCKAHYPNSFDLTTGMVVTYDGVKKLCP